MKVLIVEPEQPPYASELEYSFMAICNFLDGNEPIFYTPLGEGVTYILDQVKNPKESRHTPLRAELNRITGPDGLMLAGKFCICGNDGERYTSLTDEQINAYTARYSEPDSYLHGTYGGHLNIRPEMIDVLVVEPGKPPKAISIENAEDAFMDLVGGEFDVYDAFVRDGVALVHHEYGLYYDNLPQNRQLDNEIIIGGTFFLCGNGEYELESLAPDLKEKYRLRFEKPEAFVRMGKGTLVVPFEPKKESEADKPLQRFVKDYEER